MANLLRRLYNKHLLGTNEVEYSTAAPMTLNITQGALQSNRRVVKNL
jgi:hypothetical protein